VIDGGSTDGSVEIIRRYESHLTGWISEPDHSYGEAVFKGFQRCKGEFMCYINSGDLLLKGTLQVARQALVETGADLIFGDDVYIDEQGRVISHSRGHVRSLKHMMLYGGWTPLQDACYWRRSLYQRVGGINPTLKYAADYDFFLRASWAGRYLYVPKVFSAFRRHDKQKSISGASSYQRERWACRRRMLEQLGVSTPQRLIAETYYSMLVRWRHHVARRFHRPAIPPGAVATALVVV
jgi:glycosyltransferase involved in cell wall biosynthesis